MSCVLPIKRLDADVPLPSYAHVGDAGLDVYAREQVTIAPGARVQVATGIACAIPEGYVGLIWDKGGLSQREGLKTLGGVVDSGYRGEVMVGLVNLAATPFVVERHHKVAQMLVQRVTCAQVTVVDTLPDTPSARGVGAFGSTGK